MKRSWQVLLASFLVAAVVGLVVSHFFSGVQQTDLSRLPAKSAEPDLFKEVSSKVFEKRCAGCHGCYLAPCQMNLTSYDGVLRGLTQTKLYEPTRKQSIPPTRLHIDAKFGEWGDKGFSPVVNGDSKKFKESILYQAVEHRQKDPAGAVRAPEVLNFCPVTVSDHATILKNIPAMGMPYGLPPLDVDEMKALTAWLEAGANPPKDHKAHRNDLVSPQVRTILENAENWLNEKSSQRQWAARFIYEHVFLADFNLAVEAPKEFFRLVRSRNACAQPVDEIATTRPTDDPFASGAKEFFYCFTPVKDIIVEKNHIVYPFGTRKLGRWQNLFGGDWAVTKDILASWKDAAASSNPFQTFVDIPAKSRYQFILDDGHYFVTTFIKGPVCRGSTAINVIEEQFWATFLKPEADMFVTDRKFELAAIPHLSLPAAGGSDVPVKLGALGTLWTMIGVRNEYRTLRAAQYVKTRPRGYSMDDLWLGMGDKDKELGPNDAAFLTIMRNYDSAQVNKGAIGPLPKTAVVLDYAIIERMYYDMVVSFDVFGNIGHQLLTRVYKHLLRMEAEENFLAFLPPPERKKLRTFWYRNFMDLAVNAEGFGPTLLRLFHIPSFGVTSLKMGHLYPLLNSGHPTAVIYKTDSPKADFFHQIFERLQNQNLAMMKYVDRINEGKYEKDLINYEPRETEILGAANPISTQGDLELEMGKFAGQLGKDHPFIRYLPDTALIRVKVNEGHPEQDLIYTLMRNREHLNVAWVNLEGSLWRDRKLDNIFFVRNLTTSYPNYFFEFNLQDAAGFFNELAKLQDRPAAMRFLEKWGVRRNNPGFWETSDFFNATLRNGNPANPWINPTYMGVLDINRYLLDRQTGDDLEVIEDPRAQKDEREGRN